jgi:hypothetical protein
VSDLPPELVLEVRRVLVDLRAAHLPTAAWPAVADDLARVAAAVERGDREAVTAALLPVSQATFEGKVRGRLAGDRRAAVVVGTKPTSALPAVGAVSAALLIGIGYLLGGWLVAAVTGVFAVFIFAVALAGTRTTNERLARGRRDDERLARALEATEPVPARVVEVIGRIEARLPSS